MACGINRLCHNVAQRSLTKNRALHVFLKFLHCLKTLMGIHPGQKNIQEFYFLFTCLKNTGMFCMLKKEICTIIWTTSSEFGTYRLCEKRRFRRACASAQSRQNLRCSLIQAVSQEEPSYRKPDPWPLWMAGHAQLKFLVTECSKTQIRLTRH